VKERRSFTKNRKAKEDENFTRRKKIKSVVRKEKFKG